MSCSGISVIIFFLKFVGKNPDAGDALNVSCWIPFFKSFFSFMTVCLFYLGQVLLFLNLATVLWTSSTWIGFASGLLLSRFANSVLRALVFRPGGLRVLYHCSYRL